MAFSKLFLFHPYPQYSLFHYLILREKCLTFSKLYALYRKYVAHSQYSNLIRGEIQYQKTHLRREMFLLYLPL